MTDARLAELEALAAAATPGPWNRLINPSAPTEFADLVQGTPQTGFHTLLSEGLLSKPVPCFKRAADAEFAAIARTALPELIAEVRRLREQIPSNG